MFDNSRTQPAVMCDCSVLKWTNEWLRRAEPRRAGCLTRMTGYEDGCGARLVNALNIAERLLSLLSALSGFGIDDLDGYRQGESRSFRKARTAQQVACT